jgi:hypothetical protein
MRKTLGVAALMLALCCPALAGEMPTPPAPQPPTATAAQEPTGGDIQNDQPTLNGEMPTLPLDGLTQLALDLLAALPSLL